MEQGRGESGAEACGPDVRAELTGASTQWALVGVISERLLRSQKLHPSLVM